jgi:hypothetical protein
MSKQRRICFVPNLTIAEETLKELERIGFEICIFEGKVKPYKQSNLMEPDEVKRRLADGEDPLDLSIEKYERLIEADFDDIEVRHIDSRSCACCQKYKDPVCEGCPIAEITGMTDCRGISYYSVEIAFNTSIKSFFECVNRVLEELKGIRKKMKKKKNIIKCPFKMQRGFNAGDGLGIPFNDQKQTLFYSDFGSVYKVTSCNRSHLIPCNLRLTNKDDLKVGDTYFHCDLEISKNNPIEAYGIDGFCKYLGNSEYVYPCFGVTVSSSDWKYWYKVVPKEK